jgi:hypothetical protein
MVEVEFEGVWTALTEPTRAAFYLSGPPAMIQALSSELRGRGIASDLIRIDAWE